ncbi:hypothetical protein TorRG33x02_296340, partial [Trema orientale]
MGVEADLACPKLLCVEQIGSNNIFSFSFGKPEDHQRILAGSLWSLENQLISLVKPKRIGKVEDAEVVREKMKVWVRIDVSKPLCHGIHCSLDDAASEKSDDNKGDETKQRLRYGSRLRDSKPAACPKLSAEPKKKFIRVPNRSTQPHHKSGSVVDLDDFGTESNPNPTFADTRKEEKDLEMHGISSAEQSAQKQKLEQDLLKARELDLVTKEDKCLKKEERPKATPSTDSMESLNIGGPFAQHEVSAMDSEVQAIENQSVKPMVVTQLDIE